MGEGAEPGHENLRNHKRRCTGRDRCGYRGGAADAAAIGANCIPCSIGRGSRLISDNAMTNNVIGLRDGIGRLARGAEIRDQAGKRDRISGGQRNDALP
jgi:hypothetical protein